MKFAHLRVDGQSTPRLAAVFDDSAVFLDDIIDDAPRDLQDLVEKGDEEYDRVRALTLNAVSHGATLTPLDELRYSSAVLRPPQIIAIGANYAAHSSELKLRSESAATVFSLWPNSLTGHESTITWATDLTGQVDYEAEVGVIIGRAARNVAVQDALDYVFGYTVVNDITARDLQFSEAQWSRCKSFDGFTPTGPVVVTADEIGDPQDLWLTTHVDGRLLQDASSGDMVRTVAEIIAYLSKTSTLLPGTLISTGSPGGAGYSRKPPVFLKDGSTVTVAIDKIGLLTTHCRAL
ncbi:2-keto-4-pentenoate hydratase/2-oxohepta-3-ene-1,7-dioic acid hydratase in catechol pathway [Cryobacterium sp. MP_M5]|uniref:fumarylacetoacetate hydrolase family protein n=1 Tax=unclassified Cryobacterium TaxID=2649013 RepID=UPI0018CAE70A|nr:MULTISPECIES: fumarylacetoacetate hydrolase family protein [unclassified Cryobacterium]MBG6057373.1 2-keto-4-pentenoate hydratase/2-oxohepta-3-ene-1,7-dioic acid hydratase in catechol pathway [Cryobacterium sp. MP_M3]MEC5175572.1 2-keto-4-pentenoate hydratase/2-oxohepta-3-ene-1,7-dioic acid hydratase in catechol pathway [Cryobacterium sp. MP_M5]